MPLTDATLNSLGTSLAALCTHASLHTADPGSTGTNLTTAARQAVTWSVISGGTSGTVSASGVVTATADGTITVRATSVADPTKFDEITITVAIVIPVASVEINTQGGVPATITTAG